MKVLKFTLMTITLMVAGAAQASTIYSPTNGDVNFYDMTSSGTPSAWTLYMFDDSVAGLGFNGTTDGDILSSSNGLETISSANLSSTAVSISGPNFSGNYLATNYELTPAETIMFTNTDYFTLALYDETANIWAEDSLVTSTPGNFQQIIFTLPGETGGEIKILAVDAAIAPVPVPAAAWLFGSGLIGLASLARRRA